MKRSIVILLIALLLCALFYGCEARKAFAPEAPAEPTEVPERPVTPEPTAKPTEVPTEEPTEVPTEEPTEAPPETTCTLDEIALSRPGEEALWTPVFENITFLINGELMDSSQQRVPDDCILIAPCTVSVAFDCELEWTLTVLFNETEFLTRTATVVLKEGTNDVLIVIRADAPLEHGEYIVKLYEGDVFLGGEIFEY